VSCCQHCTCCVTFTDLDGQDGHVLGCPPGATGATGNTLVGAWLAAVALWLLEQSLQCSGIADWAGATGAAGNTLILPWAAAVALGLSEQGLQCSGIADWAGAALHTLILAGGTEHTAHTNAVVEGDVGSQGWQWTRATGNASIPALAAGADRTCAADLWLDSIWHIAAEVGKALGVPVAVTGVSCLRAILCALGAHHKVLALGGHVDNALLGVEKVGGSFLCCDARHFLGTLYQEIFWSLGLNNVKTCKMGEGLGPSCLVESCETGESLTTGTGTTFI